MPHLHWIHPSRSFRGVGPRPWVGERLRVGRPRTVVVLTLRAVKTFEEEYREMLKAYGIEFDERYLL
jgi:hypothetical protein